MLVGSHTIRCIMGSSGPTAVNNIQALSPHLLLATSGALIDVLQCFMAQCERRASLWPLISSQIFLQTQLRFADIHVDLLGKQGTSVSRKRQWADEVSFAPVEIDCCIWQNLIRAKSSDNVYCVVLTAAVREDCFTWCSTWLFHSFHSVLLP